MRRLHRQLAHVGDGNFRLPDASPQEVQAGYMSGLGLGWLPEGWAKGGLETGFNTRLGSDRRGNKTRSSGSGPATIEELRHEYERATCSYYTDCEKCAEAPSKCEQFCPDTYRECYPSEAPEPVLFEIPASNAGSDCVALSGCDTPAVEKQTEAEWLHLLFDVDLAASVTNCSGDWEFFIRVCVQFLKETADIWHWALCLVFSNKAFWDDGQLIDDMLSTGDFTVHCNDGTELLWCKGDPSMTTDPVLGVVRLCTSHELNEYLLGVFRCGRPAERLAAVINQAAILVHELCHAAWYSGHPRDADACDRLEAFESTYIWACLQRFPRVNWVGCVQGWLSSGNGVDDIVFMDDSGAVSISPGCRSVCIPGAEVEF